MYDKITNSLWFTTFFLITIPIIIYYRQDDKIFYWFLAFYMMIEVVANFVGSVTNKLIKLLEKSNEK